MISIEERYAVFDSLEDDYKEYKLKLLEYEDFKRIKVIYVIKIVAYDKPFEYKIEADPFDLRDISDVYNFLSKEIEKVINLSSINYVASAIRGET